MRTLMICTAIDPSHKGGGPPTTRALVNGLARRGHQVRCITVTEADTGPIDMDCEVRRLPPLNIYADFWTVTDRPRPRWQKLVWHLLENFNPRALRRMSAEIRDYDPDIVCTIGIQNINVATWLAAARLGKPAAYYIHEYFLMCWRGSLFNKGANCTRRCRSCRALSIGKRWMSQYLDGVCGNSRYALETHLRHGYFRHAGVHAVVHPPLERLPMIRRVVPDDGRLRIGFLGVLIESKGVEVLADAVRRLDDPGRVRVLIGGTGDAAYIDTLRRRFGDVDVAFRGWVKPDDLLADCDVLVVPSLWGEPFGRVAIEAQAHGVPAVVSRIGGLTDTIVENETGLFFPPGDAAALAAAVDRLVTDRALAARMGENGRVFAARFLTNRAIDRFETFLEATMAVARPGRRPAGAIQTLYDPT